MLLVGINGSAVYLIAYYGRIVVDEVLVVTTPPAQEGSDTQELVAQDRYKTGKGGRPEHGVGRNLDLGEDLPARPPGAEQKLLKIFLLYIFTLLALNTMTRIARRTHIKVGRRITEQLRDEMHEKVLNLSLSYHKVHTPGRLLARIISDVEILQQQMMNVILLSSRSLIMILVGFSILLVLDYRMALITIVMLPLYAFFYLKSKKHIRAINQELRHTNSCMYGLSSQKLESIKVIKAYGREGRERLNFHRLAGCFLRDAIYQQRYSASLTRSAEVISSIGTILIFLFGTHLVLKNEMTLGHMLYVYGTTATLFIPVIQLTQITVIFNSLTVILARIGDILNEPLEIIDAPDAVDFPSPVKNNLKLRNVTYAYGVDSEAEPVLRDVNLTIPAQSWVCIMGPSGAGKSTLLYLLARLQEPSRGDVSVDGIPLEKIRIASLRQKVGFVPQEAQIFKGTVRDNICYGYDDASPAQIMAAAKAAELHDFIMDMPVQYETIIGEKGTSLSGGQRQRLSLARALLCDPEVLILDDCTSALDAETERRIQNTLSRILQGKTAVIVSQRVSMAKRCKTICVVENGSITEVGSHAELLRFGGFYAKLHSQQTE